MAIDISAPPVACQIVDKDVAHKAILSKTLWVGTSNVFSNVQAGNLIKPFFTGEDYYKDLLVSMNGATKEICILGWQVSWDAMLSPTLRLYDVLLTVAKKKTVKIYVMPWDDTKPMVNYDTQTAAVLMSINDHPDVKKKVVEVVLSESKAKENAIYFSHHQKQVIIDREIAYIGGIDLSYGRYDDAKFDLVASSANRKMLNRYNPCIAPILKVPTGRLVDPDRMTGFHDSYGGIGGDQPTNEEAEIKKVNAGGWQMPYGSPGTFNIVENKYIGWRRNEYNAPSPYTLDAAKQPRMPWQDVHSRVEGPSVSDLLRNFVMRWNASGDGGSHLAMPAPPEKYPKPGNAHIQVLRSASNAMRTAENKARKAPDPDFKAGTERDIETAMINMIRISSHFIYIESQFFVSDFGTESDASNKQLSPAARYINTSAGADQMANALLAARVDSGSKIKWLDRKFDYKDIFNPPTNKVCDALIERIRLTIFDHKKPDFHVYITLPVHPEGAVSSAASIAVQVYWTMQTVAFGSHSLLNGIRRAIRAKQMADKQETGIADVIHNAKNEEYLKVPVEECFKYVTLLNLRTWAKLDGNDAKTPWYVTEQVYVHTKAMIVDDLYALLGSANVNDRSLLGERDSEIAVLVMDGDSSKSDVCGKGAPRPVRTYAHELRKNIWSKLFGIAGNVRPATHLQNAIDQPGNPASWEAIQKQADFNAKVYEDAFPHIPRNWTMTGFGKMTPASIIPNWNPNKPNRDKRIDTSTASDRVTELGYPEYPLPHTTQFWDEPRYNAPHVAALSTAQGFIVALPIHWTEGEMNRFAYPTSMVAHNDRLPSKKPDFLDSKEAVANVSNSPASVRPAEGNV